MFYRLWSLWLTKCANIFTKWFCCDNLSFDIMKTKRLCCFKINLSSYVCKFKVFICRSTEDKALTWGNRTMLSINALNTCIYAPSSNANWQLWHWEGYKLWCLWEFLLVLYNSTAKIIPLLSCRNKLQKWSAIFILSN